MQAIYNVNFLDPMPAFKNVLEGKTKMLCPRALKNYRRHKGAESDYSDMMEIRRKQLAFNVLKQNEPLGGREMRIRSQEAEKVFLYTMVPCS